MRRAIPRARHCTRLKRWRRAEKITLCLIKKASRCAADRKSKTTTFFIFHFYITERSYEKIMCIYLFDWFSGENCIIFTFFYTKDDRLRQIKKKRVMEQSFF